MSLAANAEPTKRLFLEILTRDIALEDAILDLLDNSIDSLVRQKKINVQANLLKNSKFKSNTLPKIKITFDEHEFKMIDDCGGIKINDAINDVFRFGRVDLEKRSSLSVYGIGLKRAIFKIGRKIKIESKTKDDGFRVEINVNEWEKNKKWEFPLEEINKAESPEKAGTTITITELNHEVISRMHDKKFDEVLSNQVETAYTFFLDKYVKIFINRINLNARKLPIGQSAVAQAALDKFEANTVSVQLITGLAERVEGEWNADRAGWYVLCNGRVVCFADKTELTGWGTEYASFVPKYRGFIGVAFFSAMDPEKLPWNTTKKGLNKDSVIYQRTLKRMAIAAKPIINFLNKMYSSKDAEKIFEREIANGIKIANISDILKKSISPFELKITNQKTKRTTVSVQYYAKVEDIEKVRKQLKNSRMGAGAIGEYTLKYFIEQECM